MEPSFAVRGCAPLPPRERRIVGVAVRDDVTGDAPTGRSDHRLVGVRDDDDVLAAEPDAAPPVPRDSMRGFFTRRRTGRAAGVDDGPSPWPPRGRRRGSPGQRGLETPAHSAPRSEGGEDGRRRSREGSLQGPTRRVRRLGQSDDRHTMKKLTRLRAGGSHRPRVPRARAEVPRPLRSDRRPGPWLGLHGGSLVPILLPLHVARPPPAAGRVAGCAARRRRPRRRHPIRRRLRILGRPSRGAPRPSRPRAGRRGRPRQTVDHDASPPATAAQERLKT